jgi:hypothetical protein
VWRGSGLCRGGDGRKRRMGVSSGIHSRKEAWEFRWNSDGRDFSFLKSECER